MIQEEKEKEKEKKQIGHKKGISMFFSSSFKSIFLT